MTMALRMQDRNAFDRVRRNTTMLERLGTVQFNSSIEFRWKSAILGLNNTDDWSLIYTS
jgi:hypothetical protein